MSTTAKRSVPKGISERHMKARCFPHRAGTGGCAFAIFGCGKKQLWGPLLGMIIGEAQRRNGLDVRASQDAETLF